MFMLFLDGDLMDILQLSMRVFRNIDRIRGWFRLINPIIELRKGELRWVVGKTSKIIIGTVIPGVCLKTVCW